MTRLLVCALLLGLTAALHAAHPLEGKWVGRIDTDRGEMQIGLELKDDHGSLTGVVKTAHGDWPVKRVSEENDSFVVTFSADDHEGKMTGRVKDGRFAGRWDNSPMATGTFELTKTARN